jgi:hypothetical protein
VKLVSYDTARDLVLRGQVLEAFVMILLFMCIFSVSPSYLPRISLVFLCLMLAVNGSRCPHALRPARPRSWQCTCSQNRTPRISRPLAKPCCPFSRCLTSTAKCFSDSYQTKSYTALPTRYSCCTALQLPNSILFGVRASVWQRTLYWYATP